MKDRILEMIQIRKKKGIFAKSKVEVQQSAADLYSAVIDDKIAMKIGPGDWSPNTVLSECEPHHAHFNWRFIPPFSKAYDLFLLSDKLVCSNKSLEAHGLE